MWKKKKGKTAGELLKGELTTFTVEMVRFPKANLVQSLSARLQCLSSQTVRSQSSGAVLFKNQRATPSG